MDEKQDTTLSGKALVIGATLLEKELAEALGVKPSFVKRLRYEGSIPYVRIGAGKVIYLADSILEWLRQKEKEKSSLTPNEDE